MAFTKMTDDLNIIAKLGDEPNDVDGLSAPELKAKFDEAGNVIKGFINAMIDDIAGQAAAGNIGVQPTETTPQATTLQAALDALSEAIKSIVIGTLPDGSVTLSKLNEEDDHLQSAISYANDYSENGLKASDMDTELDENSEKPVQNKAIAKAVGGALSSMAPEYDPESGTYKIGDLCIHDSTLYEAVEDIDVPVAFDPYSWRAVDLQKLGAETLNSLTAKTTTFNADGTITEAAERFTKNTEFNADGSITETVTFADGTVVTKTTVFNPDGSISEIIS